ncbi:hypothetical protein [Rhizobium hidalgonense]|uniref:hypothetical protein n=1 Tax=Rhizobium hidalgonense TaxID=1538159 RepID=UPI0028718CDE|nr:hypothetical protein [Rhizobium hidalgonense]MDR9811910.1 hypothetical protein [Rhizobium hidalgonense]
MLTQSADAEVMLDGQDDLSGIYWTPPGEMERKCAHRNLAEAISGRNPDCIKLFAANAFEIPSAFPAGFLNVAIDTAAKEACGLYRISYDCIDYATRPEWFSCKDMDEDEVFGSVYARLEKLGVFHWYQEGGSPRQFMDGDAAESAL